MGSKTSVPNLNITITLPASTPLFTWSGDFDLTIVDEDTARRTTSNGYIYGSYVGWWADVYAHVIGPATAPPPQTTHVSTINPDGPVLDSSWLVEFGRGHINTNGPPFTPTLYQKIVIKSAIETDADSLKNVPKTIVPFVRDGQLNPDLVWGGPGGFAFQTHEWKVSGTGNASRAESFHGMDQVIVPVPPRTSFAMVYGDIGPQYGHLGCFWTPAERWSPKGQVVSLDGFIGVDLNSTVSQGETLVHYAHLDPAQTYNLTMGASVNSPGLGVGIEYIIFYSADAQNSTEPDATSDLSPTATTETKGKSKANAGAVAGGVIGGVAALLIAGAAVYLLWRRKREKRAQYNRTSRPFDIDSDANGDKPQAIETPSADSTVTTAPLMGYSANQISGAGEAQGTTGGLQRSTSATSGQRRESAHRIPRKAPPTGVPMDANMSQVAGPSAVPREDDEHVERVPPGYNPEWAAKLKWERKVDEAYGK